jgi:hypothetical protein
VTFQISDGVLGRVLEIAESSDTKAEYEAKVARRFGLEQQLELPIVMPELEDSDPLKATRELA